jgi:hypothetical protein
MSEQEFENYLVLIGRLLRLDKAQREAIGEEMRDHFESRLAELTARGMSHEQAVRTAVEDFGDAAGLAAQFAEISQRHRRRLIVRSSVVAAAAALALVMVGLAVWPKQHENAIVAPVLAADSTKQTADDKPAITVEQQQEQARNDATRQKLSQRKGVDFAETPLQDALNFVVETFELPLHVNWQRLESDSGLKKDRPISLSLRDARGDMLLDLILAQADENCTYVIRDGILLVTSKQDVAHTSEIRVYDCRKLLSSVQRPPAPPTGQPGAAEATAKTSSKTSDASEGKRKRSTSPFSAVDELIDTITSVVAPSTWDVVGGNGSIKEFEGMLIVSQTSSVQDQISKLLDQLTSKLAKAN